MKKNLIIIAIFSAAFLFLYFLGGNTAQAPLEFRNGTPPLKTAPFENINLEAKSAYIYDVVKEKSIFELNADSQLPLASLTKLMTAVVAKENIPEWMLIDIGEESVLQEGDSGFMLGERWKIADLIDAMLISSSNDAAAAIALNSEDFISLMNKKSADLNLVQTYFLNATGLDLTNYLSGGYGSAKDVAKLMDYLVKKHSSLLEVTRYDSLKINSRNFKNTNKLIEHLPGIIGSKTGFSDLARGNLAVVFDMGLEHPVIIVALGSSEEGRFEDIEKLYNETIKYLNMLE
ncbi:serine hydrolase [Patescibacteria group bacterium]|nr:serine hydrolase [Patescibacteria group bacterium]MBU2263244.1 serine hydrolase [Patescibacteria group bacterium]